MTNILDVVLVGGGAYYLANKFSEQDLDFERLLIGTAVGVPAALKGPEIYRKTKNYLNSEQAQESKDKVISSLVLGATGYVYGDKIGEQFRK